MGLIIRAVLSSWADQGSIRDGDKLDVATPRDTCAKTTSCLYSLRPAPHCTCLRSSTGIRGNKWQKAKPACGYWPPAVLTSGVRTPHLGVLPWGVLTPDEAGGSCPALHCCQLLLPELPMTHMQSSLPGEVNKPSCLNMSGERTQQGDCGHGWPIMEHRWGTGVHGQPTLGKENWGTWQKTLTFLG